MNDLPLHDIHLPTAVSGWPPAIGWWLLPLIALLLGLIIYKLIQLKKQHKPAPDYKKIALQEIKALEKEFENNPASIELLRGISSLLRRIALSYLPRQSIASLTGEQWVEQLNRLAEKTTGETAKETVFTPELARLLINAPYQADAQFDQNELLDACKQWIKQLPEKTHQNIPQSGSVTENTRNREVNA